MTAKDETLGKITSAVYSPRLDKNIALGMVITDHSAPGAKLTALCEGEERPATVVEKPFYDPKKKLASA